MKSYKVSVWKLSTNRSAKKPTYFGPLVRGRAPFHETYKTKGWRIASVPSSFAPSTRVNPSNVCWFSKDHAEQFSKLKGWQYITVKGVFNGEVGAELKFCKLVGIE